jgi:hypothetical protein
MPSRLAPRATSEETFRGLLATLVLKCEPICPRARAELGRNPAAADDLTGRASWLNEIAPPMTSAQ